MGVYSNAPDPPSFYQVVDTHDCVQYTDVDQAPWFIDRINYAFGGGTDARLDGQTVRWFGYYELHIGDWLYNGVNPMTDEVLRASQFRPIADNFPTAGA
jgi:hypothetical protein